MVEKAEGPQPGATGAAQRTFIFPKTTTEQRERQANEGEGRKQNAIATLERCREAYVTQGRRALLLALLERGEATADDVRAKVELPAGVSPKAFGAVPGQLARAGIIERAGFAKTTRPEAHARPVSLWRLRDANAARAWLSAHRTDLDGTGA